MGRRSEWSIDLEKRTGISRKNTHQGVYAFRMNDTDEVVYVGSTDNLYERATNYHGKRKSNHKPEIWAKEHKGEWYFDVLLIRDDIDLTQLRKYEKEIQMNYKPILCERYGNDGISGEKHYMYGKKHTEEENQKNREANTGSKNGMYGRNRKGINAGNKASVRCKTDGRIFVTATDAGEWASPGSKNAVSSIIACCKKRQKTAYGHEWEYVN